MAKIISFGKSDVGLKRAHNEDAYVLEQELGFVAVADGMGGLAAGEVASRIFSETAVETFSRDRSQTEEQTTELVKNVFQLANEKINLASKEKKHSNGMGCTAELIAFCDLRYVIGHVGDSRTYLFRQGQLRQITRDHSVVQEQIDQGLITPEEARNHSLRHVVLRGVGVDDSLAVDIIRGKGMPGDTFLLCSDGLTDMIKDSVIQEILSLPNDMSHKVDMLIGLAKSEGGNDNITVVLCGVI